MLVKLLKFEQSITLVCLLLICFLAWIYVFFGAGMEMSAWEMTNFSLMPHQHAGMQMNKPEMGMNSTPWSFQHCLIVILMWWVMMIGMMLPSASPMVLLYVLVMQHAQKNTLSQKMIPTAYFVAGYLIIWLLFSLLAALLQWCLEKQDLLSINLISSNPWLSGGLLITAGIYQLSPLKATCLKFCQTPAQFITNYMQKGKLGALKMGLRHGWFCLGCCWGLMLLLFVGGIMNLFWIVALSIFVLIEKVFPNTHNLTLLLSITFILWGLVILIIY